MSKSRVLKQAYLFLRKLENALQALNDQQTHTLPKDSLKQAQIAFSLDCKNWNQLIKKLQQYQRIISTIFRALLRRVESTEDAAEIEDKRLIAMQLSNLWQGHIEATMAVNLLTSLGIQEASNCYQMLNTFRHSPRCRRLTQAARLRLDHFMPLLLNELTQFPQTDTLLLKVLQLLENIVGRSAYLALLTENPKVIKELLNWFAMSPFISSLVLNQPFLLENLLQETQDWTLPSRRLLQQKLKAQLAHCVEEDMQGDLLRQFKLTHCLFAARAEIGGHHTASVIAGFLADVAEVIIIETTEIACQQLAARYPQIKQIKSDLAIVAYGKLGSREMNFNSDLDLVFIHAVNAKEEHLITRLTQRIMHMLTTRSQAGVLYSVDTRLRPSGAAGLLVSPIDAFVDYQKTQAWTWEHQALSRARVISANKKLRKTFEKLKSEVLFLPRNKERLCAEVLAMRAKINRYKDPLQVKYAPGGLLDLEFLVQFLVLANPKSSFTSYTNTLSLLQILHQENIIKFEQFEQLKQAYQDFHQWLHQLVLQPDRLLGDYNLHLDIVRSICKSFEFSAS